MRHIECGPELGQLLLNLFGSLPIAFRGGPYAQRPEQIGRGPAGVTRLAEDRMKSFFSQVIKDEVDDAPGVECLFAAALTVGVHAPEKTSA